MIVLCHPYERSFCRAIAQELDAAMRTRADTGPPDGPEPPVFHDLYAERPDPVLTGAEIARRFSMDEQIQAYTDECTRTDLMCFVHPDWWSGPPALLKGWIERVFRPGVAYDWEGEDFGEKRHVPLFAGKRLAVFVTTDRAADDPPEPIEGFWRALADYCGMKLVRFTICTDLRHSGHRRRREWLRDARDWAQGVDDG